MFRRWMRRLLTFVGPCSANIFSEYNQQDATYLNLFISVRRSTCFRRFFRLSSGAQNCTYVSHLSDQYCYLLLAIQASSRWGQAGYLLPPWYMVGENIAMEGFSGFYQNACNFAPQWVTCHHSRRLHYIFLDDLICWVLFLLFSTNTSSVKTKLFFCFNCSVTCFDPILRSWCSMYNNNNNFPSFLKGTQGPHKVSPSDTISGECFNFIPCFALLSSFQTKRRRHGVRPVVLHESFSNQVF